MSNHKHSQVNSESDEKEVFEHYDLTQFPWWQDMERVRKNSKFVSGGRNAADIPPAPVNLVLTIMKEMASRPEVLAAFGSAPANGQIPPKEGHLLMWFREYLRHKYGNETMAVHRASMSMRRFANNFYKGLDDPRLKIDLLEKYDVCEDDGVNYDY